MFTSVVHPNIEVMSTNHLNRAWGFWGYQVLITFDCGQTLQAFSPGLVAGGGGRGAGASGAGGGGREVLGGPAAVG